MGELRDLGVPGPDGEGLERVERGRGREGAGVGWNSKSCPKLRKQSQTRVGRKGGWGSLSS